MCSRLVREKCCFESLSAFCQDSFRFLTGLLDILTISVTGAAFRSHETRNNRMQDRRSIRQRYPSQKTLRIVPKKSFGLPVCGGKARTTCHQMTYQIT